MKNQIELNYHVKMDKDGNRWMVCQNSKPDGKYWKGVYCDQYSRVNHDTVSVLCYKCSARIAAPVVERIPAEKSDKPKGWKFMKEYVHTDGTVYHKGIEQPSLKGTLPVTKIEPKEEKKRVTKVDKEKLKQDLGEEINKLKASLFQETRKGKRAEITRALSKANRQLKKLI